jgi:hypothetical protein
MEHYSCLWLIPILRFDVILNKTVTVSTIGNKEEEQNRLKKRKIGSSQYTVECAIYKNICIEMTCVMTGQSYAFYDK